jgi:copper resistance protein C
MRSRRFATLVVLVVVVAFVVVAVAPAFAAAPASLPLHARLVGSTPADGSSVPSAEEVVLAFNEDVDPTFVQVTVEGPGGSAASGDPAVEGREVTQALAQDLPAGEHVVTYRVVSTDGHPVSGTVTFSTAAAAASPEPTASPSSSPAASVAPSASASAAPAPSASASPGTAPAAADSSGAWPILLGALAVAAALVVLLTGVARRSGRPAEASGTENADGAPGTPAATDAGRDPFA